RATHAVLAEIHRRKGNRQAEELELDLLAQSRELSWPDPYMTAVDEQRAGSAGRAGLAFKLLEQGRQEQAVGVLLAGVRDYPNSYALRLMLGRHLASLRNFVEAEKQLCEALRVRPDSLEVLGELGAVLQFRGEFKEAARCYEQVLA